jgi:hypothetical protein
MPSLWTAGLEARRAILQAVEDHFLEWGSFAQLSRVWQQETNEWRRKYFLREAELTRMLDEGARAPETQLYGFGGVLRGVLRTPDELNYSLESVGGF